MEKEKIQIDLKKYQLLKKLDKNEETGYVGLQNKSYSKEINQLINSEIIPTILYLIDEKRDTNEHIKSIIDNFYDYITARNIYSNLDTEDKEELTNVILTILEIIEKEYLPIPN